MNIDRVYTTISTPFRRRRMQEFERLFELTDETTILDVGGTPGTWALVESQPQITLLNLQLPTESTDGHIRSVIGDGTDLPYDSKSFDIVFSNSVIEHLYTAEQQQRFAREVRRVGNAYSVQTPNRNFPVEPHYLAPGIQFLPKRWQRALIRNFTPRGWIARPSASDCEQMVKEIRLLDQRQMEQLFPDSTVVPERLLGLTKSLTAIKTPTVGSKAESQL